jgi:uncharacterized protein (TIGR02996 family)
VTDRDALLRAICETPGDDAPRLVYADWLDEHGDPRQAEFIRLHIALTPMKVFELAGPQESRLLELWRDLRKWRYVLGDWRNFFLADVNRGFNTKWLGPVAEFLKVAPTPWRFRPLTVLSVNFDRPPTGTHEPDLVLSALSTLTSLTHFHPHGTHLHDGWYRPLARHPTAEFWRRDSG